VPASFPCAAAKPTFVSLTFRGGVCKVTVVCLNGAGVQFQDPGGAGYLPVAAGYVRRGVGAGRGRCLVPCGVPCGVPARFALVLSSCWALLLVVFTATDHLCFIRAGSAFVGPLSGSQRGMQWTLCAHVGAVWGGFGELTGVLWFDAD
jgi:hypothetical protein